jgi:hypothetical protein
MILASAFHVAAMAIVQGHPSKQEARALVGYVKGAIKGRSMTQEQGLGVFIDILAAGILYERWPSLGERPLGEEPRVPPMA